MYRSESAGTAEMAPMAHEGASSDLVDSALQRKIMDSSEPMRPLLTVCSETHYHHGISAMLSTPDNSNLHVMFPIMIIFSSRRRLYKSAIAPIQ